MDMPVEHIEFITELKVEFRLGENAEVLHRISTVHPSFLPSLLMYCVERMVTATKYNTHDQFIDFIYNAVLSRITEICDVAEPF